MPPARPEVARGALRGARATVLATTALALAAAAHVVGGGTLPSLPVLALVIVPLAWGAVALTARPLGPVALTGALAASQLVLHETLMVLSAPTCAPGLTAPASSMASMAGMPGHHLAVSATGACAAQAMQGMTGTSVLTGGVAMLLAHGVATALTALLLARGERALSWLLKLVMALRHGVRHLVAVEVAPVLLTGVRAAWALDHPWLRAMDPCSDRVGRRAPPSRLRTAAATS